MFDEVLNDVLTSVAGTRCVVLAGLDGMIVSSVATQGGPLPEAIAASLVLTFRRTLAAHREAGLEPPKELTSGGATEQTAIRAVTPEYLLIAVIDGGYGLGRMRFELRKAAAAIRHELG